MIMTFMYTFAGKRNKKYNLQCISNVPSMYAASYIQETYGIGSQINPAMTLQSSCDDQVLV
jgi:hypothetical protein